MYQYLRLRIKNIGRRKITIHNGLHIQGEDVFSAILCSSFLVLITLLFCLCCKTDLLVSIYDMKKYNLS